MPKKKPEYGKWVCVAVIAIGLAMFAVFDSDNRYEDPLFSKIGLGMFLLGFFLLLILLIVDGFQKKNG